MHCDHFARGECRSCDWLDRDYADQLQAKETQLRERLSPFAPRKWYVPVQGPQQGFRNKAKMAVLNDAGTTRLGIVNGQGRMISLCDCPLYPVDMQGLLQRLENWLQAMGWAPYRIRERDGELKFLLLTRSRAHGEYLLRLVLRSEQLLPAIERALPELLAQEPLLKVVSINLQPVPMAVLEGEREIFLTAQHSLPECYNGIPLYIRPKSFFQTNPSVAEQLYATARDWVRETGITHLWDLFCGVGGFGLHCTTRDMVLTGIEREAEAIACAQRSAQELGLSQVDFQALDSAAFATQQGKGPQLVIVNPPRRGLGEDLCAGLQEIAPQYLLYSSCNVDSLVQDLQRLDDYRVERVQLFDLFPHTAHYETLVLLVRLS